MKKSDNPAYVLNKVRTKLRMANLTHELNRLQFAILTYVEANQLLKTNFTMNEAVDIIGPLFHSCINESKQYLDFDELNAIFGFSVMCLFDAINDAIERKNQKKKK